MNVTSGFLTWSRRLMLAVLLVVVLTGCRAERKAAMSDRQLFESVKTGMSRADVERLIGKPVHEDGAKAYYGSPPKIQEWESPHYMGSVLIVYSAGGIVESTESYGDDSTRIEGKEKQDAR